MIWISYKMNDSEYLTEKKLYGWMRLHMYHTNVTPYNHYIPILGNFSIYALNVIFLRKKTMGISNKGNGD